MSEVWEELNSEAENVGREERLLLDYLSECILTHDSFESALSFILANKVSDDVMSADTLRALFLDILKASPSIVDCAIEDIKAVYDRDPAVCSFLSVILYLKGYQAIQVHRLANFLWNDHRKELALLSRAEILRYFQLISILLAKSGAELCSIMQLALSLVKRQLLKIMCPSSNKSLLVAPAMSKATAILRFDRCTNFGRSQSPG